MPSFGDLLLRTVDGIFAVDARQHIALWSPGCEQLFGVSRQRALGRPCSEVVRGNEVAQQPFCGGSCCAATFAENSSIPGAFPLRALDAEGRDLRLSVTLLLVPAVRRDQRLCVHLVRRGEMVSAVAALQNGECSMSPSHPLRTAQALPAGNSSRLTVREKEVLKLLAEGLAVDVISGLMKVSVVTVRNHIQHLEAKLQVHSQAEAVAYAYRHNLV